jgi:hypothetical protein
MAGCQMPKLPPLNWRSRITLVTDVPARARRLGRLETAKEELVEALRLNSDFTAAKNELKALE